MSNGRKAPILPDIKDQLKRMTVNEKKELITNIQYMQDTIVSRASLAAKMGKSFGTKRDLYQACGYPDALELNFTYYISRFSRQEVAKRVVMAPVLATWKDPPLIHEDKDPIIQTQFEDMWEDIVKKHRIFHYIRRSDILAGLGQYSVLLLGFDDGEDLSKEVTPSSNRNLIFIQPYSEANAYIEMWDQDPASSRFNLPLMYSVRISNQGNQDYIEKSVHWSRVIHIADGLLENDVYGTPRLKCVYNRLQDLETIVAGSAEMFWQGAFPGVIFSMDADADPNTQTIAQMDDEISKYIHKLRRYMKMQGVTPHQLMPNIVSPTEHAMMQLKLISSGTGIPLRILIGSERGELSSAQDENNWNNRVDERRMDYGENILRNIIDRFIYVGILPEVKEYYIEWPPLASITVEDQARIAEMRMKAIAAYTNALGAQDIYPPEYFLRNELKLSTEEIEEVNNYIGEESNQIEEEE